MRVRRRRWRQVIITAFYIFIFILVRAPPPPPAFLAQHNLLVLRIIIINGTGGSWGVAAVQTQETQGTHIHTHTRARARGGEATGRVPPPSFLEPNSESQADRCRRYQAALHIHLLYNSRLRPGGRRSNGRRRGGDWQRRANRRASQPCRIQCLGGPSGSASASPQEVSPAWGKDGKSACFQDLCLSPAAALPSSRRQPHFPRGRGLRAKGSLGLPSGLGIFGLRETSRARAARQGIFSSVRRKVYTGLRITSCLGGGRAPLRENARGRFCPLARPDLDLACPALPDLPS